MPDLTATKPPRSASSSNPTTHLVGAPDTAMIVTTEALIIIVVPQSGCTTIRSIGTAATKSAFMTSELLG